VVPGRRTDLIPSLPTPWAPRVRREQQPPLILGVADPSGQPRVPGSVLSAAVARFAKTLGMVGPVQVAVGTASANVLVVVAAYAKAAPFVRQIVVAARDLRRHANPAPWGPERACSAPLLAAVARLAQTLRVVLSVRVTRGFPVFGLALTERRPPTRLRARLHVRISGLERGTAHPRKPSGSIPSPIPA